MGEKKDTRHCSPKIQSSFSEDDFERLASLLDISKINPEARSQLQKAAQEYWENWAFIPSIPREAKVKVVLTSIRDKAKKLKNCLENLDDKTQQLLWEAGYRVGGLWDKNKRIQATSKKIAKEIFNKYGVQDENDDLYREPDIYKLFSASERALEMVKKDKGGRPKNKTAVREFIGDLKPIYEGMTGEKATCPWSREAKEYKSQFLKFVFACLKIIDPEGTESLTNYSLGQQIKIVLSSAKSAPRSCGTR